MASQTATAECGQAAPCPAKTYRPTLSENAAIRRKVQDAAAKSGSKTGLISRPSTGNSPLLCYRCQNLEPDRLTVSYGASADSSAIQGCIHAQNRRALSTQFFCTAIRNFL